MRAQTKRLRRAGTALLGLAILGAHLCVPPGAFAQGVRRRPPPPPRPAFSSESWGILDDFNWTLLQMQRESISSQEEQQREAGRVLRRQEIQEQLEAESAEHQEYVDSVIEASRAALRAPRGVYYRKPGFVSSEPPDRAAAVEVGGITYLYERGIFWLLQGPQHVVVTAPVGAVVDALPAGAYRVRAGEATLEYFFGAFFRTREGKFEVVQPPAGVVVSYLPDGYETEKLNGGARYRFGPSTFRPVFLQGVLVYQVVAQ